MVSEVLEAQAQKMFDQNCVYNEDLGLNVLREPGPDTMRLLLDPLISSYISHSSDGTPVTTDSLRTIYAKQSWADNKSLTWSDVTLLLGMLIPNAGSIEEKEKPRSA